MSDFVEILQGKHGKSMPHFECQISSKSYRENLTNQCLILNVGFRRNPTRKMTDCSMKIAVRFRRNPTKSRLKTLVHLYIQAIKKILYDFLYLQKSFLVQRIKRVGKILLAENHMGFYQHF